MFCLRGPTFFLLGHVSRVALAVGVVALLLPRGPVATALGLIDFLRQISCLDRPLGKNLGLLSTSKRDTREPSECFSTQGCAGV